MEMTKEKMINDQVNEKFNFNDKRYLMIEIELYEVSDKILAIDCLLFKPSELDNSLKFNYEFNSNSNKENLTKFVEELNNFITLHDYNNKDLFTIINIDELEKLKRCFKQNLINLPKYLNKNLFLLDKKDMELLDVDFDEKAKIFVSEYINKEQKLNTLKIIINKMNKN